jgi:hypothetical protein
MDSDINKTVGVPAPTVTSIDVPTRERLHNVLQRKDRRLASQAQGRSISF